MNSLKELQIKAIHGMMGAEDFLEFRDSLYKTLIISKYKNLVSDKDESEEIGLSSKECHLVETCLELFKNFDIAEDYAVEKSYYLLKSLLLHFQVAGLQEANEKAGRTGLNQDTDFQAFTKENLIDKIDVLKTDYNNMKTFIELFSRQKKSLEKYCKQEFTECYDLISRLCEG